METITEKDVFRRIPHFEAGMAAFYPAFVHQFEYDGWFVSMKTKPLDAGAANHTASRECIAERDGRCINVLSGKINTLFEAERVVLSEILKQWSSATQVKEHTSAWTDMYAAQPLVDTELIPTKDNLGAKVAEKRQCPPESNCATTPN
tara:strand:- start:70 stop:513 length:444 start_codon:yes stop_codon:yes gene_type:complete